MVFKMKIWTSQKHTTSVILVKNIYSYEYMLYLWFYTFLKPNKYLSVVRVKKYGHALLFEILIYNYISIDNITY